jgi:DNA-binding winged helix-turn-helix (wHTH) protein
MRYVFGDYTLDIRCYELSYRGQTVKLRPKVFQVLAYLIAHRDRVVSKDELLEQVWPNQFIGDGSLNACLMAVRQAVGDSGQAQRCIQTLHRRGYRFVAAVEEQTQETAQHDEPTVPSRPREEVRLDAAAPWSQGDTQSCPACRHMNPAAALFCNACAVPLIHATPPPLEMSQDTLIETPAQERA